MRNSRGEIDILVLCKAISLKTLYMNIYTTTRNLVVAYLFDTMFFNVTLSVNDRSRKF